MYSSIEKIIIEEVYEEFKRFACIKFPPSSITRFEQWQEAMANVTINDIFKREVALCDYNMFIRRLRKEFEPKIAQRIQITMKSQEYSEKDISEAMKKLDDTFNKIIEYQSSQMREIERVTKIKFPK